MNPSFSLIKNLVCLLAPLEVESYASGGWEIDLHLDHIPRKRYDPDNSVPFTDRIGYEDFSFDQSWVIEGKVLGGKNHLFTFAGYKDANSCFRTFPSELRYQCERIDESAHVD